MNMGRNLGTVWRITFFDWINRRLMPRPRSAKGPRKAGHFTQAERVAVASPDGSCHNREHTPRPCNGKASAAAHVEITASNGLIMVTPDRICWLTHWEITEIGSGSTDFQACVTDLQVAQPPEGKAPSSEVTDLPVQPTTIGSNTPDFLPEQQTRTALARMPGKEQARGCVQSSSRRHTRAGWYPQRNAQSICSRCSVHRVPQRE